MEIGGKFHGFFLKIPISKHKWQNKPKESNSNDQTFEHWNLHLAICFVICHLTLIIECSLESYVIFPLQTVTSTLPLNFLPMKGEFLDLETISSFSKTHSFSGSTIVMSASRPSLMTPLLFKPKIQAGAADIFSAICGQVRTFLSTNSLMVKIGRAHV